MAREQIERWAMEHPSCPRSGHLMEFPFKVIGPRIGIICAAAGLLTWGVREYLHMKPAVTDNEEFIKESKRIGFVRQRVHGPPVFQNPFTHQIPGGIRGPEDLEEAS